MKKLRCILAVLAMTFVNMIVGEPEDEAAVWSAFPLQARLSKQETC